VNLLAAVRRANGPGVPEHSVAFRVATALAVTVAIAACWAQGELAPWLAGGAIAVVAIGNLFSYRRRGRPTPYLKLVLAAAVIGAFLWFFFSIREAAAAGGLASVEGPLAVLFTLVQAVHAFDVPSRRDLGFSLAGSATLMAVAAAQAVSPSFALYVLPWAAASVVGLMAMWRSMAGGVGTRVRSVALVLAVVLLVGLAVVAALPAPRPAASLVLPSALAGDTALSQPASLVGGGANGQQPARAASPSGRTRVGGFLGFAGPLDTAIRGALGNEVVLRVRADRPSFWIAETFNTWNGRSWSEQVGPGGGWRSVRGGPPFGIPAAPDQPSGGPLDYQTFYLAQGGPNLIFHAADAVEVWFPARRLYVGPDGSIRASTSMGPGSIYTVVSAIDTATPTQLAEVTTPAGGPRSGLPAVERAQDLSLPHPYPRVAALAARVTASAHGEYQKVVALEDWIGAHTRYTTDIPPLAPGQDTVTEFLFGNRRGYCEQISTALAVMLRSLGIPAREATGYVPGPYDPITDLYDVQARDAHAWVQVWFPHYGWQSFDPTAFVPLANPSPAAALGHDIADVARRLPLLAFGATVLSLAAAALAARWLRRRPRGWTALVTQELLRASRKAGLPVADGDPLPVVAARLDRARRERAGRGPAASSGENGGSGEAGVAWWSDLAAAAEAAAFGARPLGRADRRVLLAAARRARRSTRRPPGRRRHRPGRPPPRRAGPSGQAEGTTDGTRDGSAAAVNRAPGWSPPASSPQQPARVGRP
jgi:transglutaminase-like putative cysteine protease